MAVNKYLRDAAFIAGEGPNAAYSVKARPASKAPQSDAANTAKPGGSVNVLKMWSKDNHKTGLRK